MISRKEIITILQEIGIILEMQGENPFKSRAYTNAARILEMLPDDPLVLIREGRIGEVKGIGEAISGKLTILVNEGRLPYYEKLKASIPAGLFDLLEIPGLGPKKVHAIYQKLGISSPSELEYACTENRLRDLPGFGQKSQDKILEAIRLRRKYQERFHLPFALKEALAIAGFMRSNPAILRLEVAGSLRRFRETIKDIDLVASCADADREQIMAHFVSYPQAREIRGQGLTKSALLLECGMTCDLRLVGDSQFPFALHHSTGSKEHNTALRQRAKSLHLTMNEYGLFAENKDTSLPCENEADIFRALKLDYIEPELRENQGEIEAAELHTLPVLIESRRVRGIFHVHSLYSDGSASIGDIANKCKSMGFSYVGIADHSKSAIYANGLSEARIREQHQEIDRLNAGMKNFHIFKGIECDILPDGALDYSDEVLAQFDFVIASVHSSFNLNEQQMTARICKALEHPMVTMLGHPTGRLLLGREPYPVNMPQILDTAVRHHKIIELNANPHRLDLDWRCGKLARELKLMTAINPDAHSLEGLEDYRFGVGIARKAWFEPERALNTFEVEQVTSLFRFVRNR
jgi:DNA polymerase (family 10)